MRNPVEAYFTQLRDVCNSGAGVAETSYYPALRDLLDGIGHGLKPRVSAIINLRNTGGGIPDGGLFTAHQLKGWDADQDPLSGQLPARGAIEVKGTSDDAFAVAETEQVAKYIERYGLVLVTNLRDFVLVGRSPDGSGIRILESCRLAETEAGFWAKASTPRKFADEAGEGLAEFLRRVLLHNAPLSDPKDLAWFLASYARTARLRLESKHELPALDALRSQLEDSLGLQFEGEKGDHFFRSTLVQTLFYGMFASWVLWARDKEKGVEIPWDRRFQWETASQTLHVPMVAELFYQFSNPGRLRDLRIDEILEWAEEILWRVDRTTFFEKFREEHAVQYFYEPFLEAFDPELRKELGVWYTPDEVVQYMVARVDWALKNELNIEDGLADPSVVVLDPCCGTGAYLVEVLRTIDGTLQAKGADALTRYDVKRAAIERVIGFEIMPAPYVVAHLQLGILLAELGVPLEDSGERAAIFLTNALTGWTSNGAAPPKDKRVHPGQMHSTLLFPEFAEERDAANRVKREERIIVVLGNPPYNIFTGIAVDEERTLSDTYRETKHVAKPQGRGLNDLFVRFFRVAERQIAERMGRGIVCLITNNAWLDALSYTGMRERFLDQFDAIWIDNLNGDKYKTGKTTPEGEPDPSVFSTDKNREGIQVGTAITLLTAQGANSSTCGRVAYRDFWGSKKRDMLLEASNGGGPDYESLSPSIEMGLTLLPQTVQEEYFAWPSIPDLLPTFFSGVITARDEALVDVDRDSLVDRMKMFFSDVPDARLADTAPSLLVKNATYDPVSVRRQLQERGFREDYVVPYLYRPFDSRWLYWEKETKLVIRPRPDYVEAYEPELSWLLASQRYRKGYSPPLVSSDVVAFHLIESGTNVFPSTVVPKEGTLLDAVCPNLSEAASGWLASIGRSANPSVIQDYILSVTHAPQYAEENADALALDWSRIPLAASGDLFDKAVALGTRVRQLLSSEAPFETRLPVGTLSTHSGQLDPSTGLAVTARWAIVGKGGITMPSTGKVVERPLSGSEKESLEVYATNEGLSLDRCIDQLGDTCLDVYLNEDAYWSCVPLRVWEYKLGGYQVVKKWLSYRERVILGRDLTPEEARYMSEIVRRIGTLILLHSELDDSYAQIKDSVWGPLGLSKGNRC